jgi:hypothetical protein
MLLSFFRLTSFKHLHILHQSLTISVFCSVLLYQFHMLSVRVIQKYLKIFFNTYGGKFINKHQEISKIIFNFVCNLKFILPILISNLIYFRLFVFLLSLN